MKKIIAYLCPLLFAAIVAQAAQQEITTIGVPATLGAFRTQVNDRLTKAQSNYVELYNHATSTANPHTVTAGQVGLGTSSNPSFNSVHASGGNLAASNMQVTKAWTTGLGYTANTTSVIHGGQHYICISSHTAGSTTEPGVGASWATVWTIASGSGGDDLGDAAYSDVVALWTTCSSGYLKYDGTCATPSGTMAWPSAAGVAVYSGSSTWGSSLTVGTGNNNLVALNASGQLPFTIDLANITDTTGILAAKQDDLALPSQAEAEAGTATTARSWSAERVAQAIAALGGSGNPAIADISDWPSGLTATELGYVNGVTSGIQGQINALSAGSGGIATNVTSDPYSDVACTGAKYNSANDRFFPCLGGFHTGYVGLTDFSNPTPVTYTLTITDPGNGDKITCSDSDLPTAIDCGDGGTDCVVSGIAENAVITGITGVADTGRTWSAFTGNITGATYNAGTVTMSANRGGSASFSAALAVNDDFETDTSANYTLIAGAGLQVDYSNNGIFQATAWERSWAYNETTTGSADNFAEAVVEYTGVNESGGVACRVTNGGTPTGYVAYFFGGNINLDSFSGSTKTSVTSYSGTYTFGASTTYTLRIEASGTTIKVFEGANERISVTDSTYSTGNYIGVFSGRNVANTAAGVRSLTGGAL